MAAWVPSEPKGNIPLHSTSHSAPVQGHPGLFIPTVQPSPLTRGQDPVTGEGSAWSEVTDSPVRLQTGIGLHPHRPEPDAPGGARGLLQADTADCGLTWVGHPVTASVPLTSQPHSRKLKETHVKMFIPHRTLFPSHGASNPLPARARLSELLLQEPHRSGGWALLTPSSAQWPAPWKTRLPSGAGWWGWVS